MKKFIAELARNGRHFKKTFKGETEYEARMAVNEYLSEHPNTEFWNFTEAPTMKQPKYRHTITGEVKTRRQWIKILDVIARDLPGYVTGESFFQDRVNDGTLCLTGRP